MWRNAPMRVLSSQGDLVDSYDPALKEHHHALPGLRRALPHVQSREAGWRGRRRACSTGAPGSKSCRRSTRCCGDGARRSGAAERQKTLAAQDGKRVLCGCGLTGTCELDHVVPVR